MEFEYDPKKSLINLGKHGISLEDACQLWSVPMVIIPARRVEEERHIIIGRIDNKCFSCIFTVRDKIIRPISARRSRKDEEKIYDEKIKKTKDN